MSSEAITEQIYLKCISRKRCAGVEFKILSNWSCQNHRLAFRSGNILAFGSLDMSFPSTPLGFVAFGSLIQISSIYINLHHFLLLNVIGLLTTLVSICVLSITLHLTILSQSTFPSFLRTNETVLYVMLVLLAA